MIHFSLRCDDDHEFEGWFQSGPAFASQAKRRQIACTVCGSTRVKKAPMAPAIGGRRAENAAEAQAFLQMARQLRAQVEKTCDYVGPRFAEEARKIHYGESDPRGIYGESSDSEAKALAEEGVKFARVPWPRQTDS